MRKTASFLILAGALAAPTVCLASASIADLGGKVQYRASAQARWTQAMAAQALPGGSQLQTGASSRAAISFEDGSRIELGPDSDLTLETVEPKGRGVQL